MRDARFNSRLLIEMRRFRLKSGLEIYLTAKIFCTNLILALMFYVNMQILQVKILKFF